MLPVHLLLNTSTNVCFCHPEISVVNNNFGTFISENFHTVVWGPEPTAQNESLVNDVYCQLLLLKLDLIR